MEFVIAEGDLAGAGDMSVYVLQGAIGSLTGSRSRLG